MRLAEIAQVPEVEALIAAARAIVNSTGYATESEMLFAEIRKAERLVAALAPFKDL